MLMRSLPLAAMLLLLFSVASFSQTEAPTLLKVPSHFFHAISKKSQSIQDRLQRSIDKSLKSAFRSEQRMKRKLMRKDSVCAKQLFGDIEQKYSQLQEKISQPINVTGKSANQYLPYWDSLKTSLKFLQAESNRLPSSPGITKKLKDAFSNVNGMAWKFNNATDVNRFLKERKKQIKDQLEKFGMIKEFKNFNKQVYYYSKQITEYKQIIEDPARLERKVIGMICRLPAFQNFFKKNAEMANLFRLPDNNGNAENLIGLQTRVNVQSLIGERLASGGPNAISLLQQNVQAAQSELGKLKDKLNSLGDSECYDDDDDNLDFKPNNQKTKSFLQRLEYGTNFQSQRSTNYFPTTTDIGLSIGYKLNDKSIIGIGASYKIGLGKDIRNIRVSSQGIGFRSFADFKIKKSFFASGGFEYNYQLPFQSVSQIRDLDTWQKSGLMGISKIISLKSKLFKKTKLQLFWDMLSYNQRPQSQPFKFRVGYNF